MSCRKLSPVPVCPDCRPTLAPGGPRLIDGWLLAMPAFLHSGAARLLVHDLKYRGSRASARPLAEAMAPLVGEAECLVPIPRRPFRRLRYGVDPALELSMALAKLTGIPVRRVLRPDLLGHPHAGRGRRGRPVPRFRVNGRATGVVLIDDVVTTGATLVGAARVLGREVLRAVTATGTPGAGHKVEAGVSRSPLPRPGPSP